MKENIEKRVMYFPSKRDWWLGVLIWIGATMPFVMMVLNQILVGVGITLLIMATIAWFWFGTGYEINEKELKIKNGPFRIRVPLKDIVKVKRTGDPGSAPALSLDRLWIRYEEGGYLLISPSRQEEFIEVLKERCPGVEIDVTKEVKGKKK